LGFAWGKKKGMIEKNPRDDQKWIKGTNGVLYISLKGPGEVKKKKTAGVNRNTREGGKG